MIGFIEAVGVALVRAAAVGAAAGTVAGLPLATGCFARLGFPAECGRNGERDGNLCLSDAECDDDDACTADMCAEGICVSRSRVCGDALSCEPSTGLCVDAEGVDVCVSTYGCNPDSMSDYEATLDHEFGLTGCGEDTPEGWQVGGHCDDGTLFVSVSSGLHGEVRYFEAETGAFMSWIFLSDSIGCGCFGVYYCPSFLTCAGAVVTDVRCGTRFSVGDPIDLPNKVNWYENEFWEYCAQ